MNSEAAAQRQNTRPADARGLFRSGRTVPTAGWSDGYTQANLIAVPREYADAFRDYAEKNPKAIPVIEQLPPGERVSTLAAGSDLALDIPRYRVYRDGQLVDEPTDVADLWNAEMTGFLIGCSFTFESGLRRSGVPLRHQEADRNVPMYTTSIDTASAGPFSGPLVVSMRPIPEALVGTAVSTTATYPRMHGAPVHVGDPALIGISDIHQPNFGDPPVLEPGDVPVFWACGVTPQAAAQNARLPLVIAHAPGFMFVTDVLDSEWVTTGPRRADQTGAVRPLSEG